MDYAPFVGLALACAPQVHVATVEALVAVESSFNPWAIGLVGGSLVRQPSTRREALVTARTLLASGWNFSVGLGQINVRNLPRLGISVEDAFDPCANLAAMQRILAGCFKRVLRPSDGAAASQVRVRQALSCYYSGDYVTGFRHGYVAKVVAASGKARPAHRPSSDEEQP